MSQENVQESVALRGFPKHARSILGIFQETFFYVMRLFYISSINQKDMNKEIKIQTWLNQDLREGDTFYLRSKEGKSFYALGQRGQDMICTTKNDGSGKSLDDRFSILVNHPDIYKKAEDWKGVNPFLPNSIEFTPYDLSNILSMLGINRRREDFSEENDTIGYRVNPDDKKETIFEVPRLNWNPYFVIDGEKVPYQRGYVWSLEQKQALIDSVYRGLEIGRIIVHHKNYNEQVKLYKKGFTDNATFDIVDGKQRLSTLVSFCRGEFADSQGNYYSELSDSAKRMFMNYRGMLFGKMENVTNKQICEAFLNNAVAGTPISVEHISFINEIRNSMK